MRFSYRFEGISKVHSQEVDSQVFKPKSSTNQVPPYHQWEMTTGLDPFESKGSGICFPFEDDGRGWRVALLTRDVVRHILDSVCGLRGTAGEIQ